MKLIFPLTFLTTLLVAPVSAWVTPTTTTTTTTTTSLAAMSRRQALWQGLSTSSAAAAILLTAPSIATAEESTTLPNGVSYTVTKSAGPNAIKPALGDLVAIRFAAYSGDIKIDDIFDTPEPYYTRVGSGGLVKGVEQVLPLMSVGDRWVLTIPGELAFGKAGRPSSPGKPRIPPNAVIVFDVEMVGLPGKEVELIELIGDE